MLKVAINGMGRIGRAVFKIALDTPGLALSAVNDLTPLDNVAYLLKYDTVYGRFGKAVSADRDALAVDGNRIPCFGIRDPSALPWRELGVQVVFECTGVFAKGDELAKHVEAGAQAVILSAPAKSGDVATVVHGVNSGSGGKIFSCASCTTNSIAPVAEVLSRRIGIRKALMTTVHAYTASQSLVDGANRRVRRGRAAAANLVPTSTGAAVATTKVLPRLEGKFDGVAVRAPVAVGSLSDITLLTERPTSVDEVNGIFREEAGTERYEGILGVSEDPLVSSDVIMDPRAAIVDLGMTQVVDGDLLKVMCWYDNEWGYASQMVREAKGLLPRS